MAEHLKQILEFATSQGYKSNTIKPLIGIIIILLLGASVGAYLNSDIIVISCIIFLVIFLVAVLFAYFFCLYKDPNLLRSERYNLEKTAIEKATIKGDSYAVGHLQLPHNDYVVMTGIDNQPHITNNNEINSVLDGKE